jgi:hypothetical protein
VLPSDNKRYFTVSKQQSIDLHVLFTVLLHSLYCVVVLMYRVTYGLRRSLGPYSLLDLRRPLGPYSLLGPRRSLGPYSLLGLRRPLGPYSLLGLRRPLST